MLRARLKHARRPLQSEEKPALPALLVQLAQLGPLAKKVILVQKVILVRKVQLDQKVRLELQARKVILDHKG